MSSLILPRRFTQQPQGPVEVDWSNPLTDGLIVAFSAGSGFRNIAASTELVKVGTPNLSAVTQEGVAANFALASNDGLSVGTSGIYNPSEQTIFVIANPTSFGTSQGMMLFSRDSNTLGRSFTLDIYNFSSFGARYYVNGGGTLNTNELRENVAPTEKRYAVCATQIGSNAVLYLDGKSVASSSEFQAIASSTGDTQIGRRTYVGYTQSLNGTMPFAAMWKRALSPKEVAAVNNNPWQLFRAKHRVLYFTTAGGASASISITTDESTVSSSAYVSPLASLSVSSADSAFSGSAYVSPVAALVTTTADAVPSSSAYVSPAASLAVTTESATFSGSAASGNGASLSITTDSAVFSGSASVSPVASFTVSTDESVFNGSASAGTGASLSVDTAAAVFSGSAYVAPIAGFALTTELAVFAGSASVSTPGTGTLDEATIAAIADAVWAHSSAVDFSDRMDICSRILRNRTVTDPNTGVMTVYADDGVTPYLTAQLHEDAAQTQTYRGQGAEVRGRLQ